MTAEERAREFAALWEFDGDCLDDLVYCIRAAENDALERAARHVLSLAQGGDTLLVAEWVAGQIRSLKHPEGK